MAVLAGPHDVVEKAKPRLIWNRGFCRLAALVMPANKRCECLIRQDGKSRNARDCQLAQASLC